MVNKKDKICDYCGGVGKMPTFMDNETICFNCINVLPMDAKEARKQLHDLRITLLKAQLELESWNLTQGDKDTAKIINDCREALNT